MRTSGATGGSGGGGFGREGGRGTGGERGGVGGRRGATGGGGGGGREGGKVSGGGRRGATVGGPGGAYNSRSRFLNSSGSGRNHPPRGGGGGGGNTITSTKRYHYHKNKNDKDHPKQCQSCKQWFDWSSGMFSKTQWEAKFYCQEQKERGRRCKTCVSATMGGRDGSWYVHIANDGSGRYEGHPVDQIIPKQLGSGEGATAAAGAEVAPAAASEGAAPAAGESVKQEKQSKEIGTQTEVHDEEENKVEASKDDEPTTETKHAKSAQTDASDL